MQRFTVVLTPEPDGSAWNVTVPALPGCFTWGATIDEALVPAKDAIALFLADESDLEDYASARGDAIVATVSVELSSQDDAA